MATLDLVIGCIGFGSSLYIRGDCSMICLSYSSSLDTSSVIKMTDKLAYLISTSNGVGSEGDANLNNTDIRILILSILFNKDSR